MPSRTRRLFANAAGLAVSASLLLLALNLIPDWHPSLLVEFSLVPVLWSFNFVSWYRTNPGPMSPRAALTAAAVGFLLLLTLAILDMLVGYLFGHRATMSGAFLNSGPFGGVIDIALFAACSLIGVPHLVRAVIL